MLHRASIVPLDEISRFIAAERTVKTGSELYLTSHQTEQTVLPDRWKAFVTRLSHCTVLAWEILTVFPKPMESAPCRLCGSIWRKIVTGVFHTNEKLSNQEL